MKHIKSERLKKLETELNDLQQWLHLGLVPKKEIEKHKIEITSVQGKIKDELDRLQFLKDSDETDDYVAPKRQAAKPGYTEMATMNDMDMTMSGSNNNDTMSDIESEPTESAASSDKEEVSDDYFDNRNRWHRSGILDPDADEW